MKAALPVGGRSHSACTLRESSPIGFVGLRSYCDQHEIGTSLLFAGNLTRLVATSVWVALQPVRAL